MKHPILIVKLRLRRLVGLLFLSAGLSCLVAVASYWLNINGMQQQEVRAYDNALNFWTKDADSRWSFWAKQPTPSKDVAILAIDEKTFQGIEENPGYKAEFSSTWPFARDLWALVFQYLNDVGAKAIAVDMLLFEKKPDDLLMIKTVKTSKIPIVFGFTFDASGKSLPAVTPQNRQGQPNKQNDGGIVQASSNPERAGQALAFPVVTRKLKLSTFPDEHIAARDGKPAQKVQLLPHPPMETLWEAASGFGLVMTENMHSSDGLMRKTKFAYTDGRNAYITLSLATMADLWRAEQIEISPGHLRVGNHQIRINQDGSAWINYGGTLAQRFKTVSLIDLIDAAKNMYRPENKRKPETSHPEIREALQGKVVLIGGFASGTADLHGTPYETFTPGVIKHAAEIDCLMNNTFISDTPLWVSIAFTFAVALGAAFVMLILQSGKIEIVWPIVLSGLTYLAPGFLMLYFERHILSVVPSFAAGLSSFGIAIYFKLSSVKRRRELKDLFGHTMNAEMAELVSESNPIPDISGERKEATALIIDHKLFTTLASLLHEDPETCSKVLKQCLQTILQILLKEGAYVDTHARGGVTGLFGAPLPQADASLRACRAALAIQRELNKQLSVHFKKWSKPIHPSIGINAGNMWVGNLNKKEQLTYAALGSAMDLAIYLERMNQIYGTQTLVGPQIYERLKDHFAFREIDWVWISATQSMISIYELLMPIENQDDLALQKQTLVSETLALYRKGAFLQAATLSEYSQRLFPEDQWLSLLEKRCKAHLAAPPPGFDGRLITYIDIDIETEMLL